MNNKGSFFDIIVIISILFIGVIISVIGLYFINNIAHTFSISTNVPSSVNIIGSTIENETPGVFDFVLIAIIIGLPLISMILAFFTDIHPILFFVIILLTILVVFTGIGYKYMWEKFATTEVGLFGANNLPMTTFIMNNFSIYVLFCSFVIIFASYVKIRSGYQ